MKKIINFVVLFAFIIQMTGCATILKDKTTKVKIDSEPQGAEIFNNVRRGKLVKIGQTPTTLILNNKHNYYLIFRKNGYKETGYTLRSGVATGWMLVSFVCCIFPAWIDFVTKNARNFRYDEIKVSLGPALPMEFKGSIADELLKYKKLLDSGAITKTEFEQKKKQLLGP